MGYNEITCMADGDWSVPFPICKGMNVSVRFEYLSISGHINMMINAL